MNRLYGYILTALGLIVIVFFLNYEGDAIPLRELWFSLGLFVLVAGAYFQVKHKWSTGRVEGRSNAQADFIDRLMRTGEVVRITLDNCEVRTRNWQQEVQSPAWPSRMDMLDAIGEAGYNPATEEIRQTYLVFYKDYGGRKYKFVSNAITKDAVAVRIWMDRNGGVNLYVDKDNPAVYYFNISGL